MCTGRQAPRGSKHHHQRTAASVPPPSPPSHRVLPSSWSTAFFCASSWVSILSAFSCKHNMNTSMHVYRSCPARSPRFDNRPRRAGNIWSRLCTLSSHTACAPSCPRGGTPPHHGRQHRRSEGCDGAHVGAAELRRHPLFGDMWRLEVRQLWSLSTESVPPLLHSVSPAVWTLLGQACYASSNIHVLPSWCLFWCGLVAQQATCDRLYSWACEFILGLGKEAVSRGAWAKLCVCVCVCVCVMASAAEQPWPFCPRLTPHLVGLPAPQGLLGKLILVLGDGQLCPTQPVVLQDACGQARNELRACTAVIRRAPTQESMWGSSGLHARQNHMLCAQMPGPAASTGPEARQTCSVVHSCCAVHTCCTAAYTCPLPGTARPQKLTQTGWQQASSHACLCYNEHSAGADSVVSESPSGRGCLTAVACACLYLASICFWEAMTCI